MLAGLGESQPYTLNPGNPYCIGTGEVKYPAGDMTAYLGPGQAVSSPTTKLYRMDTGETDVSTPSLVGAVQSVSNELIQGVGNLVAGGWYRLRFTWNNVPPSVGAQSDINIADVIIYCPD
jgi:hypothetical protein